MATRFHVVSSDHDNELDEIRNNRLKNDFELAGTEAEFKGVLDGYDARNATRGMMDLISHSAGVEAYLELGDWKLDDVSTVFFQQQKALLLELEVKNLRLIGCHTAASTEGWDAILHIANVLGNTIVVWGTKAAVYARNFTTDGYDDSSIVGSNENYTPNDTYRLPVEAVVTDRVVRFEDQLHFSTPTSPFVVPTIIVPAFAGRDLLDTIVAPLGWSLPGLLTKPNVTVMVRVGNQFVRFDVLLAFNYLRIFTAAFPHGLVYRVRRGLLRDRLRAHLTL